jgi:dienelactone hydrolase
MRGLAPLAVAFLLALAAPAAAAPLPPRDDASPAAAEFVSYPSRSPFALVFAGGDGEEGAPTEARATWFAPRGLRSGERAPAVVMLHGSGGVLSARELAYGRQFAAAGVGALVVDSFSARRDVATSFLDRLIRITETMLMADAYAGLGWLAARPEIDPARVALIGFSYGGMASTYAVQAQVAELLAPAGPRFAAHVSFYAPCIARFADRRTTGAPVLMLSGGKDAIVDPARCAEVAEDLREGGSSVETIVYPDAVHQWDGGWPGPRRIGRNLAPCRLTVARDALVRDEMSGLAMTSPLARMLILGLCADPDGYLIGADESVRARSDADLGRFLMRVFAR